MWIFTSILTFYKKNSISNFGGISVQFWKMRLFWEIFKLCVLGILWRLSELHFIFIPLFPSISWSKAWRISRNAAKARIFMEKLSKRREGGGNLLIHSSMCYFLALCYTMFILYHWPQWYPSESLDKSLGAIITFGTSVT